MQPQKALLQLSFCAIETTGDIGASHREETVRLLVERSPERSNATRDRDRKVERYPISKSSESKLGTSRCPPCVHGPFQASE